MITMAQNEKCANARFLTIIHFQMFQKCLERQMNLEYSIYISLPKILLFNFAENWNFVETFLFFWIIFYSVERIIKLHNIFYLHYWKVYTFSSVSDCMW